MKVFIDGLIFGRQKWGGISRMWEEYLVRLPQHVSSMKLLIPFSFDNQSLEKVLKYRDTFGVVKDYFYWPVRYFERVKVRSKILKILYLNHSYDIFHSTLFSTVFDKKIKTIVTVHDMIPEIFYKDFSDKWSRLECKKKEQTLRNADKIITVSHNTKKDLLEIYPWISEKKVKVIYHGLFPEPKNNPPLATINQTFSLDLKPFKYFLYVGNRCGYKNFDILLSLIETNPRYKESFFLCVGGEKPFQLEAYLEVKGLRKNFLFINYLSDDELSCIYKNASALIFPSKYEGFGLPVLEAMANDCPVVCSNKSSLPEVGGEAAFYFDADSTISLDLALKQVLKADRTEVIRRGKANTKRFSWDKSCRKLADVYEDAIS
jgi:glycosyltransferase involved in cell wall biosynthesis